MKNLTEYKVYFPVCMEPYVQELKDIVSLIQRDPPQAFPEWFTAPTLERYGSLEDWIEFDQLLDPVDYSSSQLYELGSGLVEQLIMRLSTAKRGCLTWALCQWLRHHDTRGIIALSCASYGARGEKLYSGDFLISHVGLEEKACPW